MKLNEKIILVMVAVLSLFFVLVTNLVISTVNPSDKLVAAVEDEKNEEKRAIVAKILRGAIYDRNGEKLAYSEIIENADGTKSQKRLYPYEELFAHTVGFYRGDYAGGRKNLEDRRNDDLIAVSEEDEKIVRKANNDELFEGASLKLTLDLGMTQKAEEEFRSMAKKRGEPFEDFIGSVVVMNPTTGEIYCMYSNPSFNPDASYLSGNWNVLENDERKPFVSRATGSIKEPGSTFKVVTAIAALENGKGDFVIEDNGSIEIDGQTYSNSTSYKGKVNIKKALEVSSNVYFASLSQELGNDAIEETARKFYMCKGQEIKLDILVTDPGIDFSSMSGTGLAEAAFGQGKVQVTPLHMAMVASAVANGGDLMKPYLVDEIRYSDGKIDKTEPEILSENVMSSRTASIITEGMINCVNGSNGTGKAAKVGGMKVAGKTGTAENPSGADHTWFIGFAPAENPQIAICVMCENSGGGGGSVCGPIAKGIFEYCRDNGFITE